MWQDTHLRANPAMEVRGNHARGKSMAAAVCRVRLSLEVEVSFLISYCLLLISEVNAFVVYINK